MHPIEVHIWGASSLLIYSFWTSVQERCYIESTFGMMTATRDECCRVGEVLRRKKPEVARVLNASRRGCKGGKQPSKKAIIQLERQLSAYIMPTLKLHFMRPACFTLLWVLHRYLAWPWPESAL